MTSKFLAAGIMLALVISHPAHAKKKHKGYPDARLTIVAPESSHVRTKIRDGVRSLQYRNRYGALATAQWPFILRLESRSALGYAESATADERKREALVFEDPDGCLNLASLVDDFMLPAFDADCAGLPEDEIYTEVQTEKFDSFELEDNRQTGNDVIRDLLVDDAYVDGALLNTPYLKLKGGKINAVGPKTGEGLLDGYGYGPDDDAAGFVVMADIGGARVFDRDFNLVPGVIRNMGGFFNTISSELLDGKRQTAITATMHPLAGVFEPIAVFDFSVTNPDYAGYDYLSRVDSGPVTAFELMSEVPVETDPKPKANEFYDELLATYYPVDVTIRAVVVERQGPQFIRDLNQDGKYTAADLQLAGYELLSNEVEITLTLTHDNLLIDSEEIKCLPRTVIFADLDGDGKDGEPFKCSGKSGSSRSRRVPQ